MTLDELKKKMHEGPVHFSYKKKNGEIREAYGTLNTNDIPYDALPKGTGVVPECQTRYYDLDKDAWRSFQNSSLIDDGSN